MNVYIDASEKGGPFYDKHFGVKPMKLIDIPEQESIGKVSLPLDVRSFLMRLAEVLLAGETTVVREEEGQWDEWQ